MEKIGTVGKVGLSFFVLGVINNAFSKGLALYVITQFNFVITIVVLYGINLAKYWLMIVIYDKLQIDPLHIEAIKKRNEEKEKKEELDFFKNKLLKRLIQIFGENFLFVYDAFLGVIYKREGHFRFDGIPKKLRKIFFISILISTLIICIFIYGISNLYFLIFR